ncbi:MAG: hypothetical protein ACKVW3_16320 [Phycisphaerales bacterium]
MVSARLLLAGVVAVAGCAARQRAEAPATYEVRNQTPVAIVAKIVRHGALDTNSWLRSALVPPGQSRSLAISDGQPVDLIVDPADAPATRVALSVAAPVLVVSRAGERMALKVEAGK